VKSDGHGGALYDIPRHLCGKTQGVARADT